MNFFGQGRRERTRIERLENATAVPRTTSGSVAQSIVASPNASQVDYTPSNPLDWPTVPTNVAMALDLLAARLQVLEGSATYTPTMIFNLIEQ